ncbi:UEV-domain-containing protein [Fomitiporia mediterranea MF3/22]|uniref:UEV-domain-containing protein n=1 Tax=Fomitiporia mediterranea (strain MF3/22) TaxID=694068 RepID=UPI00044077AE|nr:UEV-domain-containing protein [Fomitiporia mediterranea MF3/22]EJD06016.1 UEV-domain-containing protein [Fomitiporia mediterranea MF3/22]
MSSELTANWLKQNIARYHNADRVYTDVLAALDHYPSLRPKTDVYTFDDGRTQLLLCVHGLLPISFRNASYNIPVALWVLLSYPAEAPLVYVVPTSDMLVKPSPQVDHSGKCNIDYTSQWPRKPEACSLLVLLEAMQSYFSNDPPLYAKSRPKHPAGPSSAASPAPSSPSPSAAHVAAPMDRGHVSHTDVSLPPRLPPKPFAPSGPALPVTPGSSTHVVGAAPTSSSVPTTPNQFSSPSALQTHAPNQANYAPRAVGTDVRDSPAPPVPPHPAGYSPIPGAIPPSAPSPAIPRGQNQNSQGPPPYVPERPPVPPHPPVPPSPFTNRDQNQISVTTAVNGQSSAITVSPPPVVPRAYSQPLPFLSPSSIPGSSSTNLPNNSLGYVPGPGYQQNPAPQVSLVTEPVRPPPSLPPPDLLDENNDFNAVQPAPSDNTDAAPPPRPPNPQTVALHNALLSSFRDALARLAATHADAVARQRAAQAELLAGPEAIRDESARLVAVRDVCSVVGDRWSSLITDGEHALGEMRRRGEVSVDEMVCASSIVGNQLVNLVAEDNAIEDTIYHLHRALNSGRIDLERFLRTTRVLAEEQFMKRALVEKILRGLPMGMALR